MIRLAIKRCPELDPVWIVVFVSVLLNDFKPPRKIITSVLETQSSTFHELWCTIEPVSYRFLFPGTVELIAEVETYSLYVREHSSYRRCCHADQVEMQISMVLRRNRQLP